MDALLMCGGEGSRLGSHREKPLVRVGGVPMVDHVADALPTAETSGFLEAVFAVTTPTAPNTADHVDLPRIETPGEGYVSDLQTALADDRVTRPVLTVAADLPLLDGAILERVLSEHDDGSLTVAVPVETRHRLGLSVAESFYVSEDRHVDRRAVVPAGVNVVASDDSSTIEVRAALGFAVNVNRPSDLAVARQQFRKRNRSAL